MEMASTIFGQLAIWRIDSKNFIQAWRECLECFSQRGEDEEKRGQEAKDKAERRSERISGW